MLEAVNVAGFDWDEGNRHKCRKHGVPIAEIEALFGPDVRLAPDRKHSSAEDRFIAVGRNVDGRPMFVAFTLRSAEGQVLIRPVSARYMHRKEMQAYDREEEGSQAEDR